MTKAKIGFVGAGNMARSLIGGLIADGYSPDLIFVSNPTKEKLDHLQGQYHVNTSQNNSDVANTCDVLVLSVKPQVLASVVKELAEIIRERKLLVISIAAGVRENLISSWIDGAEIPVVRCMPNTPALVQSGATALFANQFVSLEQKNLAESILRSVGITLWLENESLMDVVTALSASGTAYFFLIMESLQKAAVDLGMDEDYSRLLTIQTALGSAKMALELEQPLDELRRQVTSPGGTTERALAVLQEGNLSGLLAKAVDAATDRSKELSEMLSNSTD